MYHFHDRRHLSSWVTKMKKVRKGPYIIQETGCWTQDRGERKFQPRAALMLAEEPRVADPLSVRRGWLCFWHTAHPSWGAHCTSIPRRLPSAGGWSSLFLRCAGCHGRGKGRTLTLHCYLPLLPAQNTSSPLWVAWPNLKCLLNLDL